MKNDIYLNQNSELSLTKRVEEKDMSLKEKAKMMIPDSIYLRYRYRKIMGKSLNLNNPQTFNEKLQWLKLYDRKPIYTTLVDKYEVKPYVAGLIGEQYIIPTLGVWEHFDDIDFDKLPDQFVLKCSHDSGGLVICSDKRKLDKDKAKQKIEVSLKKNFYWMAREWPYKNVKPRIIAEQYMADDLRDYKYFCFNDEPKLILVCSERFTEDGLKEDFYNESWKHLDIVPTLHQDSVHSIPEPVHFETMRQLAKKMSEEINFSRIDFYEVEDRVYFGEITFYPESGFEGFRPDKWDNEFGKWLSSSDMYCLECGGVKYYLTSSCGNLLNTKALVDYKFFCYNGVADCVMVCTERETGEPKFYFFDRNWELRRWNIRGKNAPEGFSLPKPSNMDKMFEIAEKLSIGIPYVRVDLYSINGNIYFGEMTFYPQSGFDTNLLEEADIALGEMLDLTKSNHRFADK